MLDAALGIGGHGPPDHRRRRSTPFFLLGVDPARLVAGRAPDTQHTALFPVSAMRASERLDVGPSLKRNGLSGTGACGAAAPARSACESFIARCSAPALR